MTVIPMKAKGKIYKMVVRPEVEWFGNKVRETRLACAEEE